MILGIDYLGGQNYIDVIVKSHPKGFAAGFLMVAAGWKNGIIAARALAETGRCPVMRLHGEWHDDHRFDEDDIPNAVAQAEKVAKLAAEYPQIQFYFSPWLEHHAKNDVFKKVKKACRNVLAHRVPIVCCGPKMPSGINETHHDLPVPGPHPYVFSFDGLDMKDTNVARWRAMHQDAIQFYGWTCKCNGKRFTEDKTPRWKRTNWLTEADVREIKRLLLLR